MLSKMNQDYTPELTKYISVSQQLYLNKTVLLEYISAKTVQNSKIEMAIFGVLNFKCSNDDSIFQVCILHFFKIQC